MLVEKRQEEEEKKNETSGPVPLRPPNHALNIFPFAF
jgi:hypothetical protein